MSGTEAEKVGESRGVDAPSFPERDAAIAAIGAWLVASNPTRGEFGACVDALVQEGLASGFAALRGTRDADNVATGAERESKDPQ